MEREEFGLGIKDDLSGPAGQIRRELQQLKAALKGTGTEIDELKAKQLKYREAGQSGLASQIGLEISKRKLAQNALSNQTKDAIEKQKAFAKAQKDATKASEAEGKALQALGGELLLVAKGALIAAAAFGALILGGLKLAAEAYTFRKHMSNVFEVFKGTAAEGEQTYEMVRAMSRTLPIPQEKAFESAQELLSLGLQGQNRLHNTVQSIANMQAVMGDQAGSKLKSIITGAQETTQGGRFRGVFSATPADLKAIGLSYDQLTAVLAKKLGQSNATTKQMLMYGRIDAATGIDAINEAVTKGAIGSKVKDALLAPDVLAEQFATHVKDLFKDVDAKPLLREVRNIINMFDQGNQTGRNMKKGITETFTTIIKWAKEALIQIQIAVLDLEYYGLIAATAFAPMIKELKHLGENKMLIDAIGASMNVLLGATLGVLAAAGAFVYIWAAAINLPEKIRTRLPEWERLGLDLVVGLTTGVAKGAQAFKSTMKDVADGGLKTVKEAFDSHSPSRKMMAIGRGLTEGLRMGAGEGGLLLGGSAMQITAKALPGAGSGGAIMLTVAPGAVVIQGGNASGPEVVSMVQTAFADLAEQIAEELGRGRD